MARCVVCNTLVLFGGKKEGDDRYCGDECYTQKDYVEAERIIPDKVVKESVDKIYNGPCPKCDGQGLVNVRKSYRLISAVVYLAWDIKSEITCKKCARPRQIGAIIITFLLGWWGIWGPFITPYFLFQNFREMLINPDKDKPKKDFEKIIRKDLAEYYVANKHNYKDREFTGRE